LTVSVSDCRAPNSFWNAPSGITAKLSCELPKTEPFFSLTPTTRKGMPGDLDVLFEGIDVAEQLVRDVVADDRDRLAAGRLRSGSSSGHVRSALKVPKSMYSPVTPWIETFSTSCVR
jgi:hypothetical protein